MSRTCPIGFAIECDILKLHGRHWGMSRSKFFILVFCFIVINKSVRYICNIKTIKFNFHDNTTAFQFLHFISLIEIKHCYSLDAWRLSYIVAVYSFLFLDSRKSSLAFPSLTVIRKTALTGSCSCLTGQLAYSLNWALDVFQHI